MAELKWVFQTALLAIPTILFRLCALLFLALPSLVGTARAQWVTEGYALQAGWNSIWLSHDATHAPIGDLMPAQVEEVWRWNPTASTSQFIESPALPVQPDTQWLVWRRLAPQTSTLGQLDGNAAYLVKVADDAAPLSMSLTGRPLPPRYQWASSGLNFFGFPMQAPDDTSVRSFDLFLSHDDALASGVEVYSYTDGTLTPNVLTALFFEPVSRGRAYWIESSEFSNYYGPLQVTVGGSGLDFGDTGTAITIRIRNVTDSDVTATLTPTASATPPAGQDPNAGAVPLLLRGAFDPGTGQFDNVPLDTATDLEIAAGAEQELLLLADRAAMGETAGQVFQSILQLTDSEGISRIDLPVRAEVTSRTGLWLGSAILNSVDQITAVPATLEDGTATAVVDSAADADAPAEFPIRLILSRADNGLVKLLQQVYVGENTLGNVIASATQDLIDPTKLASARRVSSSSFPPDTQVNKSGDGLGLSGTMSFSVPLDYTDPANPFVHIYHPDHDNKDAHFSATPLPEGKESFTVVRDIELSFIADPADLGLTEPGWGSTVLGGHYTETFTGLRAQPITAKGVFILRRVLPQGLSVPRRGR